MRTFITSKRIVTPSGEKDGVLIAEDGVIRDIASRAEGEGCRLSASVVMPGFVEIHAHGGGGADFSDATEEAFRTIIGIHKRHGVTTITPTTVACSEEVFFRLHEIFCRVKSEHVPGLHLEGPFISKAQKGAQNPNWIREPSKAEVDRLMERAGGDIALITAAPEIGGIEYLAKEAGKRNITLSVGHSDAVFADVERARTWGFSHVTHLYCNTPGERKIGQTVYAGIWEAAYTFDDMTVELIGDGHHVANEAIRLAVKCKGADHVNITSDAMRAAGTSATESYLGEALPENRVIIEDGVAKLPDRTSFAGSVAVGDDLLKTLVSAGISLTDAAAMLSATPARVIGKKDVGALIPGKRADVVLLDDTFTTRGVVTGEEVELYD